MNPYSSYPQQGYGYPPVAPPPNTFYAPPQYNGYPTAYRRPSDPGSLFYEASRRQKSHRRPSDSEEMRQVPLRISEPTRPRKNSFRMGLAPDHIFVSFSSHDVLKMANLTSGRLVENLQESLLPFWPQGIASQSELINGEWVVTFLGGDVWSATGSHGIMARRLVCRLFVLLAEEGFGYTATVDINSLMKSPRMVFTSVPPDPDPRYFMISFSSSRRTLTIIDAPEFLALLLGAALRATGSQPQSFAAETSRWLARGVYEIVTNTSGIGRQDLATLMGGALKLIAAEGYRFEASVPLGRSGLFGLRGRKEVWMFRRVLVPKARKRRN